MKLSSPLLATAIAFASFSPAVFAQEEGVTLRVTSGSAMTSQGGDFVTAASGTMLEPGSRVMLAENSTATLVYSNGCTQPLTAAGVYGVPATCVPTATARGATATGVDVKGALIVAGTGAIVAAGLASMDDVDARPPPAPISR